MAVTLTYDSMLSRVKVSAADSFSAAYITVERSTDGLRWTLVRGADHLDVSAAQISDYEFTPGVINTYRARSFSAVDVVLGTETNTITPTIDRMWLKSVTRPFLNMPVTVRDYSPVSRKSRAGLFDIPGRSLPIRVGDAASSRSWTTEVITYNLLEARALEFLIESGDCVYVQVPSGFDIPGGYVGLGDMGLARISRPLSDGRRQFSLPMTAVAPPPPSVVGYTATWAGLLDEFGTWTAVLAAFPTWNDVLQHVADPETIVVP